MCLHSITKMDLIVHTVKCLHFSNGSQFGKVLSTITDEHVVLVVAIFQYSTMQK